MVSGRDPSPMAAVLAQFRAGATSLAQISAATGLDPGIVTLTVDRLTAMGYLTREELAGGCPPDTCGGCAASGSAGQSCSSGPQRSSGPVLLRLTSKPGPA